MPWYIDITGTSVEVTTALRALVVPNETEATQYDSVEKTIEHCMGIPQLDGGQTCVPASFNALVYKFHVTAHGHVLPASSKVSFSIQIVDTVSNNNICGNPPNIPTDFSCAIT